MNGKRNGYGKEYYNDDKFKFEGEYFNGKRSGIEKIYYDNGQIKIESEYIDDKLWNMKEYDKNNNVISEIISGKRFF